MLNFEQKGVDFIGREALLKQRETGVTRQYVQLLLNDHDVDIDAWCWGNEPIYRNGKYCGMTTTTGYGFTFKKQVGYEQLFNNCELLLKNEFFLTRSAWVLCKIWIPKVFLAL